MAKPEYVQKKKQWLEAKAKEPGVVAIDGGIYYKVIKIRFKRLTTSRSRQCGNSSLYRQDNQWQDLSIQAEVEGSGIQAPRPYPRLDNRIAAHAYRR